MTLGSAPHRVGAAYEINVSHSLQIIIVYPYIHLQPYSEHAPKHQS